MKNTIKIFVSVIFILIFGCLYKTFYLFSNYVVIRDAEKIGSVIKEISYSEFVCPDGANYNLLLVPEINNIHTCKMQPSIQGKIKILENTQNILQYSFTTEYCNWLDSKKLSGVIVRPVLHQFTNLDQYLTPKKRYVLELTLPENEENISVWIHFEKKVKVIK